MTVLAQTSEFSPSIADVSDLEQDRREKMVKTLQNMMSATDSADELSNT